ncbi:hypothetical protein EVAR_7390_1 [Eumeta japonica]|uniref:Mos1 transposase HTH domain-containing protein n=1 Tax=Eumeta variegata TaxID=151549 RepID=A0A4C1V6S3_EUMVA|nr:hypothetical protein EVAR_7390_1 [Eumeta japonica]
MALPSEGAVVADGFTVMVRSHLADEMYTLRHTARGTILQLGITCGCKRSDWRARERETDGPGHNLRRPVCTETGRVFSSLDRRWRPENVQKTPPPRAAAAARETIRRPVPLPPRPTPPPARSLISNLICTNQQPSCRLPRCWAPALGRCAHDVATLRNMCIEHAEDCTAGLQNAFGREAPDLSTIRRWCAEFFRGRVPLHDEIRESRPSTAVTEENVATVRQLIEDNRRVPITRFEDIWG